jgi:hypothetical protein
MCMRQQRYLQLACKSHELAALVGEQVRNEDLDGLGAHLSVRRLVVAWGVSSWRGARCDSLSGSTQRVRGRRVVLRGRGVGVGVGIGEVRR